MKKLLGIGIGGPVGSGKTAIIEVITPVLIRRGYKPLIVTNDVVTTEDAKAGQKNTERNIRRRKKSLALKQGMSTHSSAKIPV